MESMNIPGLPIWRPVPCSIEVNDFIALDGVAAVQVGVPVNVIPVAPFKSKFAASVALATVAKSFAAAFALGTDTGEMSAKDKIKAASPLTLNFLFLLARTLNRQTIYCVHSGERQIKGNRVHTISWGIS